MDLCLRLSSSKPNAQKNDPLGPRVGRHIWYPSLVHALTVFVGLLKGGPIHQHFPPTPVTPRIYINAPNSDTERLLRELMGPPDMRHFNLGSCATEYDHVLDMSVGKEPVGVQRYGPELHPKVVRKLEELLADFTPRSNAANKFLHAVKEADDALAILYLMDDAPELPKEAVYRLRIKLNRAGKWLEDMPTSILPLPPKKKATNPGETNHIYGEPSSDEEDSEEEEEDPEWDDIEIIEPRNWEAGNDEHLIHVIIYAEHNKAPFHARFRVAAGKSLDISTYPIEWSTATFIAFSVLNKEYECVKGPINMEGRGNVMVYRKYGVHPGSCPRSGKWERLAMQAVEEEIIRGGLSEPPPSSPPWPSSSTQVSMARSATPALVASSTKSKGKGPLDILEDGLTEQGDKLAAAAPMAAALSSGLSSMPVGPAAPVASCSISKGNGKRPAEAALAGPAAKKANRGSSAAYPIYLE
ncbi:hypothetical protein DFH09DRAFT_1343189 [Mycena vulgaris]|nr:hypothetical protein DFH09DRAFT_1343189 [Mycena vulgaris]